MRWILHTFTQTARVRASWWLYRCLCDNKFSVSRPHKSTSHVDDTGCILTCHALMCDSYFSFGADLYAISRRLFDSASRTKTKFLSKRSNFLFFLSSSGKWRQKAKWNGYSRFMMDTCWSLSTTFSTASSRWCWTFDFGEFWSKLFKADNGCFILNKIVMWNE